MLAGQRQAGIAGGRASGQLGVDAAWRCRSSWAIHWMWATSPSRALRWSGPCARMRTPLRHACGARQGSAGGSIAAPSCGARHRHARRPGAAPPAITSTGSAFLGRDTAFYMGPEQMVARCSLCARCSWRCDVWVAAATKIEFKPSGRSGRTGLHRGEFTTRYARLVEQEIRACARPTGPGAIAGGSSSAASTPD